MLEVRIPPGEGEAAVLREGLLVLLGGICPWLGEHPALSTRAAVRGLVVELLTVRQHLLPARPLGPKNLPKFVQCPSAAHKTHWEGRGSS